MMGYDFSHENLLSRHCLLKSPFLSSSRKEKLYSIYQITTIFKNKA